MSYNNNLVMTLGKTAGGWYGMVMERKTYHRLMARRQRKVLKPRAIKPKPGVDTGSSLPKLSPTHIQQGHRLPP